MVGYSAHSKISIRHRSGTYDVPVGDAPYTAFVNFPDLSQARAFIDAGRNPAGHVVFDMATQAPLFNPQAVAAFITAKGYLCTVEGDVVIVQDPVYVERGAAAGRFAEFKAVTLRTDAEARRFLSDRS